MLDINNVRKDFPFLRSGRIYLDSTATSLTPEPVLRKVLEYYHEYRANVGRGIYNAAQAATFAYENARAEVAKLINAKPNEVIFVRNATEAINLIANGLKFQEGEKIVTTILEHHSNYIVWLRLKNAKKVGLSIVKSDKEGLLSPSDFISHIDRRTRLVAVTQTSNVLGVRPPVKDIVKLAHEEGSFVLVDGAQSVPHAKVDVKELDCDFLAFSGHKMCGPTGVGALYIKEDLQELVEPLCIGGGSIEDVGIEYYRLRSGPGKYEAGTPPIAEAIGMGAAAVYLMNVGMGNIEEHERKLTKRMLQGLANINGIVVYGPRDAEKRAGIVSFNLKGMNPHDVAVALDTASGVMVRSGHHCALPLHKHVLNAPNGTVRASVYLYNNNEDVDVFLETLEEISKTLA
ncbi:MAG: cysteine desulfurase [Candidatus Methanomethyliaceae archaeon]|nr:cysteine desulfurase [Candidatus Methanomethyliaceae archaeon]